MLKTAFQLGFEQALADAGVSPEDFEKWAIVYNSGAARKALKEIQGVMAKQPAKKPSWLARLFGKKPPAPPARPPMPQPVRASAVPQVPMTMERSLALQHAKMQKLNPV